MNLRQTQSFVLLHHLNYRTSYQKVHASLLKHSERILVTPVFNDPLQNVFGSTCEWTISSDPAIPLFNEIGVLVC